MAEFEGQQGAKGDSATDETLRHYLLCRLGEDERLKLDERLLTDDEFAQRMLLAESELVDAYASGGLDTVERRCFEKSFLTTDARRQKLHFSSALHDYAGLQAPSSLAAPVAQQRESGRREGLAAWFGFGRPRAWALAGSFAILIIVTGLAWLVFRQQPEHQPVIVRNEPIPASSPAALQRPDAAPAPLTTPEPQPTPSRKPNEVPTPPPAAAPPTIASFVLLPGSIRDGGDLQRVAVPDGERAVVRFSLVLETDAAGSYQAEVATVEGQTVTVRSKLKADGRTGDPKLTIDIPARLLRSGDYQIKLTRQKADGQSEPVRRYYFRALD
jgi:hypothetical protein